MSKHFHTGRKGWAQPQLDTLKGIIVIGDKANQEEDTGASISAGNGMTLADSHFPSSWCFKGWPVVTRERALFNGVQWRWFLIKDREVET